MKHSDILEQLVLALPEAADHHDPATELYGLLKKVARREVESLFSGHREEAVRFHPFGELVFPYHPMGAVDSLNLFDLDELILFSYYWRNRNRYRRVLDIGANIGLHSIVMSRCGFEVDCYEPDPRHFELLLKNLGLNGITTVRAHNVAMSTGAGEKEFVRVRGNTTGSHLSGAKANPYGDLDRFPVKTAGLRPLLAGADLVKMDIEGHEKEVILSTDPEDWRETDAFVEVENPQNGAALFEHFRGSGVQLYSQKRNWGALRSVDDMPTSYREGSLFIAGKDSAVFPGVR